MTNIFSLKMRRSESYSYGSESGLYSGGSDSNGQTPSLASIYQVKTIKRFFQNIPNFFSRRKIILQSNLNLCVHATMANAVR